MFHIIKIKPNKRAILGGLVLFFCFFATPAFARVIYSDADDPIVITSQPDLVVEDIKFYRPGSQERPEDEVVPQAGKPVTCKAILINTGSVPTGLFNVRWLIDGIQTNYSRHSRIMSGVTSNGNVRFDWSPVAGTHTISFIADTDNQIIESEEGNNSFNLSINLKPAIQPDSISPKGSIKINDDSQYTNSTQVTLKLYAEDNPNGSGLSQMEFFDDSDSLTSSGPEPYSQTKSLRLSRRNGIKTISVRYRDQAGNWSDIVSDNIILDTEDPTGSIKINNDAAVTDSTQVVLTLTSKDAFSGVARMQLSNDNITWAGSEAYASTKDWRLTAGDGEKTVFVRYQDRAGNSSVYSDTIELKVPSLDVTAPITSVLGIDGSWHNTPVTVILSVSEPGSVTYYSYKGEEPQTLYKGPFTVSEEGAFTLKYYSIDKAGNPEKVKSAPQQIKIDRTPPEISVNAVNTPTEQNVTLTYTVSDNLTPASGIIVTGDNSPYTNEGNYNVTLTAKDKAGNTSTSAISFTIYRPPPFIPPTPPPVVIPPPLPPVIIKPPVIVIASPKDGEVVEAEQIKLEGTVDGVFFSEDRTLTQEENTLTKTATNAQGKTSSASVTVFLRSGEVIGLEGGSVSSSDGRIKVIIPSGALSEPKRIKVLSIDKEAFQGALPSGKSLLSVVECRPYGLVFSKPVSLIYALNSAEVPGTSVELGLYDKFKDKITSTGQASVVPKDGYTLNFSLVHFSTYAALKGMVSSGAPIGGGVKIPLPDMFTGAFSSAIPITVPPARKGMQPALGLVYRSSNSNSWVGMGFSLNPGYIVRSTKLGPPTYIDTQDTFYFVSDAGTTELVWLIDNLYQAKIESGFTKFFKEADDSWRVVAKDGSTLRFGQAPDSKEGSILGTFSWYLTKAVDTNGNYIQYQYVKDEGKSYLSRIDYTGNEVGVSPTNTVEFSLEPRDDISSSYLTSAKIATARRLKEIQAKVDGQLVWRYELEYAYSSDTDRSLLKSVKQYASDDRSLPAQKLTYQKAE